LSRLETVSCTHIASLIVEASKTTASMTGQEERDMLLARHFGLVALLRSGLATHPRTSSEAGFVAIVNELIALGNKKSWLRESIWWAISQGMEQVHASAVDWKSGALRSSALLLFEKDDLWSPEKVSLVVQLQAMEVAVDWKPFLCPPFKNPLLITSSNLTALARILKVRASRYAAFVFTAAKSHSRIRVRMVTRREICRKQPPDSGSPSRTGFGTCYWTIYFHVQAQSLSTTISSVIFSEWW
jgi:DNA polymerase phi